jgi:uncharacterized protein
VSENTQVEVTSPCIGVCAINESGLCQGCFRNIDEIKSWWDMSQQDQQNLLVLLEERQLQQVKFDD